MEENTHPIAGNQTHISLLRRLTSKTPGRHRPVGPTGSGAQRVPWFRGPQPGHVHQGQGPLTWRPVDEGPFWFRVVVKPWCPWCVGFKVRQAGSSSTSAFTVCLLRITFTVTAHPHYLFWTAHIHPNPTKQTLSGSLSGSPPNPTPAPSNLPFLF